MLENTSIRVYLIVFLKLFVLIKYNSIVDKVPNL